MNQLPKKIFPVILFLFSFFMVCASIVLAADTVSPVTTHEFIGTIGNNGWYTSTVDVTLRTSDLESGPASTTYWLNGGASTTYQYFSDANGILNPSFEDGSLDSIDNWEHNSGSALFWQSSLENKFDWKSAATAIFGNGIYYWHNRAGAVTVTPGDRYTASVWVKTVELFGGTGAWLEVWAKGAGDESTDFKIIQSEKVNGETSWQYLARTFNAPTEYNQIYFKLCSEDAGFIGVSFWDGASLNRGEDPALNFVIVENGDHIFHYYSSDNEGNQENAHDASLKIDTIAPQYWQNFSWTKAGNDHTYSVKMEVRDLTSGIDTATAEYAYFTDHQDLEWDHNGDGEQDWYPAVSVTRVDNGQPAVNGYTGFVKINSPAIDFGDSATVMKVQFRIRDMAGNLADSPVQMLFGPWIKLEGKGDLYSGGDIIMQAGPPAGLYNTDSLIMAAGNNAISFTSAQNWILSNYSLGSPAELRDFIQKYDIVRSQAVALPSNKLPGANGIYYYTGNYTVDTNSISTAFLNNTFSAIIIIEGNVTIKNNFTIKPNSTALFLITGNLDIWGNVGSISGFFISQGPVNTSSSSQGKTPLTIYGSLVSAQNFILSRDLGRRGSTNNTNTPAEKIIFQPKYPMNFFLGRYLGAGNSEIDWIEVSP